MKSNAQFQNNQKDASSVIFLNYNFQIAQQSETEFVWLFQMKKKLPDNFFTVGPSAQCWFMADKLTVLIQCITFDKSVKRVYKTATT